MGSRITAPAMTLRCISFMPIKDKVLLSLHDVRLVNAAAAETDPINLTIRQAERIQVICGDAGWREDLWAVLSGTRKPKHGVIEELNPVTVQSDRNLKDSMNLNRTLGAYLESPDAPLHVWLDQRRREIWVLVNLLGITPSDMRRPLKFESKATIERYLALRFLISGADLLLGDEIYKLDDMHIKAAFRRRWGDLPGAVIITAPPEYLPGQVDTTVHIGLDGSVAIESGAAG